MHTASTTKNSWDTRRALKLLAGATAIAMFASACGSDSGTSSNGQAQTGAADTTAQNENDSSATDETPTDATGFLVTDQTVRFSQLDWTVLGTEIRADGPGDDGEDVDPAEDFVYVDLEVSSPTPNLGLAIPIEWIAVADAQGVLYRAASTDDKYEWRITVDPMRSVLATAVIPVDSGTSFEGGWVQLDQEGRLPAALGGPQMVDEAARLPVTFDTTTYDGPLGAADAEATIEILEAFWSRELGLDSAGFPLEPAAPNTYRPEEGHVFLLVHYEITGRVFIGGTNHYAGSVIADGDGSPGAGTSDGMVGRDETEDAWAVYEVPVDAESVTVAMCGCGGLDQGGRTNFNVTDFGPLEQLATPAL